MKANYTLASVPATHYTGALVQYQAEEEEFPGLRGDGLGKITGMAIRSAERLDWQIEIWDGNDNVMAKHSFVASDADEITVSDTTYFYYNVLNLEWPIPLTVPKLTVSVALRNMSADAKTAGTDGAVTVYLFTEK